MGISLIGTLTLTEGSLYKAIDTGYIKYFSYQLGVTCLGYIVIYRGDS